MRNERTGSSFQPQASARKQRMKRGFTLAEMLVVLTIGAIIAMAIYRSLGAQQNFYTHQKSQVAQQDALNLAGAILMTSLMDASGSQGDFAFIADDSIGVRAPVGFAIVCAVDVPSQTLGLIDVSGRVGTATGDSVLVYSSSGWETHAVEAQNLPNPPLSCPYAGGPALEKTIRVSGSLAGVPVGAPVRAFHPFVYRLRLDDSSWWLAREDANGSQLLAGPFKGDGSGLSFTFLDALGNATSNPAAVARVDLTLVTEAEHPSFKVDTLSLSTSIRNQ